MSNKSTATVRAARSVPGVQRIALLGSLANAKSVPKDADVLVTIDASIDLAPLARIGRRLKGTAQTINLSADIFVADETGRILDAFVTTESAVRAPPAGRSIVASANT